MYNLSYAQSFLTDAIVIQLDFKKHDDFFKNSEGFFREIRFLCQTLHVELFFLNIYSEIFAIVLRLPKSRNERERERGISAKANVWILRAYLCEKLEIKSGLDRET